MRHVGITVLIVSPLTTRKYPEDLVTTRQEGLRGFNHARGWGVIPRLYNLCRHVHRKSKRFGFRV